MAEPAAAPAMEENTVKLEFQNFGSSGEGITDGRIGGYRPPASDPIYSSSSTSDRQTLLPGGEGAAGGRSWNPLSLSTYQQYFDVDTMDVYNRLRRSVSTADGPFLEADMKPDLYGPFWLCTTLIFTMAAAGNLGSLLSFVPSEDDQVFVYNFSKLTVGTSVLYGYTALVPFSAWAASKWLMAEPFGLAELICVYGYSLAIFIPAACACVVPFEIARWLILAAAFALSARFIVKNVRDVVIRQLDEQRALVLMVIAAGAHGALALFLKLYFYS
mmetsp:Transcript_45824/g.109360  ORF Transcript_45824/g.109360 Transcript_45824/m.109360 type:complete len:273 (+) Transcript_45824:247-1065(+)